MRALRKVRLRIRSLLRRRSVESELETELRFHFDQQMEENLASGMALTKPAGLHCVPSEALPNIRRSVVICAA